MLPDSLEVVTGRLVWQRADKLTLREEDYRRTFTAGWNAALRLVALQGLGYSHPTLPQWHEREVDA